MGNDDSRTNWVNGENSFNAKIFISDSKRISQIVIDILLDIQMYYILAMDSLFSDFERNRKFSRQKAEYVKEKGLESYLGEVETAEYVSFASFCRIDDEIDYNKYINLCKDFMSWVMYRNKTQKVIITPDTIDIIVRVHPQGGQISIKKIWRLLMGLDSGNYLIIKTESKPRYKRAAKEIASRFGMKKWKNGKLKVVSSENRYVWERLKPFVSMWEFSWKKEKE
ncbi:MAG: hypothetical protein IJT96_09070 [Lachnospiraceae bacterium]|nr:hypothetical protein [Lachnospiraceae bacterium]